MNEKINTKQAASILFVSIRMIQKMSKCGVFKTAEKMGRDWFISYDEVKSMALNKRFLKVKESV